MYAHHQLEIKKSIDAVLNIVIDQYCYTSLTELNAILRLYNVKADMETSMRCQYKGLLYLALGINGEKKGKAIRANSFSIKPTLNNLKKKFEINTLFRELQQQRLTTAIDRTTLGFPPTREEFLQSLEKEGISVIVQKEREEDPESIFFIDHQARSVFEGESLGEEYSLKAILEKCTNEAARTKKDVLTHHLHLYL